MGFSCLASNFIDDTRLLARSEASRCDYDLPQQLYVSPLCDSYASVGSKADHLEEIMFSGAVFHRILSFPNLVV